MVPLIPSFKYLLPDHRTTNSGKTATGSKASSLSKNKNAGLGILESGQPGEPVSQKLLGESKWKSFLQSWVCGRFLLRGWDLHSYWSSLGGCWCTRSRLMDSVGVCTISWRSWRAFTQYAPLCLITPKFTPARLCPDTRFHQYRFGRKEKIFLARGRVLTNLANMGSVLSNSSFASIGGTPSIPFVASNRRAG